MAFELPPLPYAKDALAPHISAETLEYHYGKHHQTYVTNLNKLIEGTEFENASLEDIILKADGGLFNNSAQVWNHTFYWNCHVAQRRRRPDRRAGRRDQRARSAPSTSSGAKFTEAAITQFGSGWAWLVDDGGRLEIIKTGQRRPAAEARRRRRCSPSTCGSTPTTSTTATPGPNYVETFLDSLVNWDFVAQNMG